MTHTRLIVNLGVTGHRNLPLENLSQLEISIRKILQEIRESVLSLHQKHAVFFAPFDGTSSPCLRIVSSLAEGADRLVVKEAMAQGYELQCPLPFARDQYEQTFSNKGAVGEFRELIARASSVFEIECSNSDSSQSYADASRVMMDHSDFLIALWNGEKTKYIAGTYATMQDARASHIPILYIPIHTPEAITFIIDTEERKDWQNAIRERLAQILLPVENAQQLSRESKEYHFLLFSDKQIPLSGFQYEKKLEDFLAYPGKTVSFHFFKRKFGKLPAASVNLAQGMPSYVQKMARQAWNSPKKTFSSLSACYANKYRDRLLLRYILPVGAMLALIFALYGHSYGIISIFNEWGLGQITGEWVSTLFFYLLQVALLLAVIYLVWREGRTLEHKSFYSCRILAERCRQSLFLWPMGFCNVRYKHRSYFRQAKRSWRSWYYRALAREKGLPNIVVNASVLREWLQWLYKDFIQIQSQYHSARVKKYGILEKRLRIWGQACFSLGVAATLLRAVLAVCSSGGILGDGSLTALSVSAGCALFFPCLASFWASFSNNAGYPVYYASSHEIKEVFTALQEDVNNLLNRNSLAGRLGFHESLCFTDALDLCERIDSCCMDELSDWENTVQSRNLKYL